MGPIALPILLAVLGVLWLYLLYSAGRSPAPAALSKGLPARAIELEHPRRFRGSAPLTDPPPLAEIERNITHYLNTLHSTFENLQGTKAIPVDIWEAYLDVTKKTVMKWDDENRHRFPKTRSDNSIFVSLGTYRGELKSTCGPAFSPLIMSYSPRNAYSTQTPIAR